jgi:hypothetical protein
MLYLSAEFLRTSPPNITNIVPKSNTINMIVTVTVMVKLAFLDKRIFFARPTTLIMTIVITTAAIPSAPIIANAPAESLLSHISRKPSPTSITANDRMYVFILPRFSRKQFSSAAFFLARLYHLKYPHASLILIVLYNRIQKPHNRNALLDRASSGFSTALHS